MKRLQRQGIVLITTLLMTVLVVMILTVVLYTGAGGLALTANFYEREAALLAADSGLQYAMTRLQANPNWRGDGPDASPVDLAGTASHFSVLEKNGNVYGFLSTLYGHKTQFRIKFNYEDGAAGLDGLPNTGDTSWRLATNLVSINNLLGTAAIPATRAQADGVGPSSDPAPYLVPRATACILVEGVAGWGVASADDTNPNGFSSNRAVTRRVVEAYLGLDETAGVDAAAYAAGTIEALLPDGGRFELSSRDDDISPRLRSLEGVSMAANPSLGGGSVAFDGGTSPEVVVGPGNAFTVNGTTPTETTVTESNSADLFKRLGWDAIAKASPTSTTDAQIKAGTYIWRMAKNGKPWLEYFDAEFAEGAALPAAGSGTAVTTNNITTQGRGVEVDTSNLGLLISNNVYVNPTGKGGPTGVAFLTDPALSAAGLRPNVGFVPPASGRRASILTAPGSVRVEGAVLGTGSITSEGNISFQGPSIFESDPETGVSIYAKGDITVEALPEALVQAHEDLAAEVETQVKNGQDPSYVASATNRTFTTDSGQVITVSMANVPPGLITDTNTFKIKKADQLEKLLTRFGEIKYADQDLTGVLYTWGDFRSRLENRGVLNITGTLIAYGGNPGDTLNPHPGTVEGKGKIDLQAEGVSLTYDPTYLKNLLANLGSIRVKRNLWATW